jgi:hypothetical protein
MPNVKQRQPASLGGGKHGVLVELRGAVVGNDDLKQSVILMRQRF